VEHPDHEPAGAFAAAVDAVRRGERDAGQAALALVARLTDDELLWLLDGDLKQGRALREMGRRHKATPMVGGHLRRLGIPGIRFTDGPRGVVLGNSTSFPVAIARAASWDVELERAVGDAVGAEARAHGANLVAGVCVNLAPFPGWGRSQESYGEDPVLLGAMGVALTRGLAPWVMSCVKHYALNSMEEARFGVDVRVDQDVLREVYLPHFRSVVEAGADSVMSAYNSVNGAWAGESRQLLTGILRDDWGFTGFVMTDFVWGLRHPVESVAAGQDLEMPMRQQRARALPRALRDGRLDRRDAERSATRLLATQIRYAARARPAPPPEVVASPEHRELARLVAGRGCVLLRNEPAGTTPALPLDAGRLRRLAVVGRLAEQPNLGDVGSSEVRPPAAVTVLDGLRDRLGERVLVGEGAGVEAACAAARAADAAVVVVGLTAQDEGEALVALDTEAMRVLGGVTRWKPAAAALSRIMRSAARWTGGVAGGDRRDLRLHAEDVELVRAVGAVNARTVVVVIGGGAVVVDPWDREVSAVLLAWYPGMEGGRAIADVLLGDAEPGGRLPVAIPHRQADLPGVDWTARTVTYGRWWGQRALDRAGIAAAYPFGFGLSYTTFALGRFAVGPVTAERFSATVDVTNTGDRAGRNVVQIYARRALVRALLGFACVEVEPGLTRTVTIDCDTRPLQRWTGDRFTLATGRVVLEAAGHSGDPAALTADLDPA